MLYHLRWIKTIRLVIAIIFHWWLLIYICCHLTTKLLLAIIVLFLALTMILRFTLQQKGCVITLCFRCIYLTLNVSSKLRDLRLSVITGRRLGVSMVPLAWLFPFRQLHKVNTAGISFDNSTIIHWSSLSKSLFDAL